MGATDWLKLIPADQARRILLQVPPVSVERVPLRQSAGRVLAAALNAPHDLPPARLSAMDGYAVRARDLARAAPDSPVALRVVGQAAAGHPFAGTVGEGQAVTVVTGGVIPDGSDAVVMVEQTTPVGVAGPYAAIGGEVRVAKDLPPGSNIVPAGEDLRAGAEALAAGRRLRPGDLSALAAFGVVEVEVYRRPRIAVLATGTELVPPEETPRPGQVRDSNQYVLSAEVEAAGARAIPGGIVGDDLDLLRSTVTRLCADNDGLVLSGGSSVGPKDLTGHVLSALEPPGVLFHGIDIRPGKPTVFARAGAKPVLGMPGFPTSSMVVFEAFVRPLLARLGGEAITDGWVPHLYARLAAAHSKPASREDYLRVRLADRDGDLWAEPLPGGSAAISNVLYSDGLARIPAGIDRIEAGARVAVRRFV